MAKANDKSSVTVADVIEHLKTLPQDMEVWSFWDEGGYYYPLKNKNQGSIETIHCRKVLRTSKRKEWKEVDVFTRKNVKSKRVCVLHCPFVIPQGDENGKQSNNPNN